MTAQKGFCRCDLHPPCKQPRSQTVCTIHQQSQSTQMSYIVAFVRYSEYGDTYPVECFRTDLKPGDEVITRNSSGMQKVAKIVQLKYLNWKCQTKIQSKLSELHINNRLQIRPPKFTGLATKEALIKKLRENGWKPFKPPTNVYQVLLTQSNSTKTANILIRANGIDIQLLELKEETNNKPYSQYTDSVTIGKFIKHHLSHTPCNLFEKIIEFSEDFLNNEPNLEAYFTTIGKKDKRTEELKNNTNQKISRRIEWEKHMKSLDWD